jgi:hypothetical protein
MLCCRVMTPLHAHSHYDFSLTLLILSLIVSTFITGTLYARSLVLSFSHSLIPSFTRSLSLILSFSHSLILSISHSLIYNTLNIFLFCYQNIESQKYIKRQRDVFSFSFSLRRCLFSHDELEVSVSVEAIERICSRSNSFSKTILPTLSTILHGMFLLFDSLILSFSHSITLSFSHSHSLTSIKHTNNSLAPLCSFVLFSD